MKNENRLFCVKSQQQYFIFLMFKDRFKFNANHSFGPTQTLVFFYKIIMFFLLTELQNWFDEYTKTSDFEFWFRFVLQNRILEESYESIDEAGATFDNSFFDNYFGFLRQCKNRSFLASVFVHATGRSQN
jgi:hypothetical protein